VESPPFPLDVLGPAVFAAHALTVTATARWPQETKRMIA